MRREIPDEREADPVDHRTRAAEVADTVPIGPRWSTTSETITSIEAGEKSQLVVNQIVVPLE
jgi:hypothetical protein